MNEQLEIDFYQEARRLFMTPSMALERVLIWGTRKALFSDREITLGLGLMRDGTPYQCSSSGEYDWMLPGFTLGKNFKREIDFINHLLNNRYWWDICNVAPEDGNWPEDF